MLAADAAAAEEQLGLAAGRGAVLQRLRLSLPMPTLPSDWPLGVMIDDEPTEPADTEPFDKGAWSTLEPGSCCEAIAAPLPVALVPPFGTCGAWEQLVLAATGWLAGGSEWLTEAACCCCWPEFPGVAGVSGAPPGSTTSGVAGCEQDLSNWCLGDCWMGEAGIWVMIWG